MTGYIHKPDCAIALNARHGCTCGQAPHPGGGSGFARVIGQKIAIVSIFEVWIGDEHLEGLNGTKVQAEEACRQINSAHEARVKPLVEALECLELGCSFPSDDLQRAVRDRCRQALEAFRGK